MTCQTTSRELELFLTSFFDCIAALCYDFDATVIKSNDDLKKKVEDLQTEMKKFKAVFLKQENRIRQLETKLSELSSLAPEDSDPVVPIDTSSYKVHNVRKEATAGYVVHAGRASPIMYESTLASDQVDTTDKSSTVNNNNCELAPDEV
ncbi:hypothetical protein Avbf_01621 [Armadillidium vulgare]|nr:hypothetical protein Avbf_01621 [Armadillidium vulgare]